MDAEQVNPARARAVAPRACIGSRRCCGLVIGVVAVIVVVLAVRVIVSAMGMVVIVGLLRGDPRRERLQPGTKLADALAGLRADAHHGLSLIHI